MPLTVTTTQIGLSVASAAVLAKTQVAEFAPGEIAYTQDTKTYYRLDRTAMAGDVPVLGGFGYWIVLPFGGGGGGSGTTFVYQPAGFAAGNVYTNPFLFAAAIAAAGNIADGYIDCTFQSPAPWPVQTSLPGLRLHQSPLTNVPAIVGVVDGVDPNTGNPTQGSLLDIVMLDGVGVVNTSSTANYMVQVGGPLPSGAAFTMTNGAYIQRANDGDILALGINPPAPALSPFQLNVIDCVSPFPNLGDAGAWNVQFNGGVGSTLNVLLLTGGPSFHLPSFSAGPGPALNIYYDDTIPTSQLAEGAWQGTVSLVALATGANVPGFWFVDISGDLPSSPAVGNGSLTNPFNLIQSAINAAVAKWAADNTFGQVIQISPGFSNESLVMPPSTTISGLTFRGSSTLSTVIQPNAGPAFFWQPNAVLAPGQTPSDQISFENIQFNTQDLVSDTVTLDGSVQAQGTGGSMPFQNVRFYDCQIDIGGGNPSTGTPLVLKSASVLFIGDDNNASISGNGGSTPSLELWNGQFGAAGQNVNVGMVKFCADFRPGAPPISGTIASLNVSAGAQIGEVQARGTPVIFVGNGGTLVAINSYALDPLPTTGFATNVPGALVGGSAAGLGNLGPVIGIGGGTLGFLFGNGAPASLITFGFDAVAFPAPVLGPAFLTVGGATIAGTFDVENTDAAPFAVDWSGAKLAENIFNGVVSSFTAGNNVIINLANAAFDPSTLHTTGTGRFVFGPGYYNVVAPMVPPGGAAYTARGCDWFQFPVTPADTATITLPDATTTTSAIRFSKGASGTVNVVSDAGQTIYGVAGAPATNFLLPDATTWTLEPSGGAWWRTA